MSRMIFSSILKPCHSLNLPQHLGVFSGNKYCPKPSLRQTSSKWRWWEILFVFNGSCQGGPSKGGPRVVAQGGSGQLGMVLCLTRTLPCLTRRTLPPRSPRSPSPSPPSSSSSLSSFSTAPIEESLLFLYASILDTNSEIKSPQINVPHQRNGWF